MRKIVYSLIIIVLLLAPSLDFTVAIDNSDNRADTISSEQYEKGYRYNTHGWIYLHIEGEPYERGYQHGYLLADEIVDMIQRWKDIFPQTWSWDVQRKDAVRLFWNKYPEEYKQEIQGIADGVKERRGSIDGRDVDYKDILAMNEMYEMMSRFRTYSVYVLRLRSRWFYSKISMFLSYRNENVKNGMKCSAFLATGDATVDGGIVGAHSTFGSTWNQGWWHNYICERWNVVLDIEPSRGYRMLMTTSPGHIWSDEDFYQNSAGMILMETTLDPLGSWRKRGDPIVVRARTAIQYSKSIDEMIETFVKKNNGLMANDWLIGDTKTGEIASLELAYYNHAVTRTKNGVIWSCNNAKDAKVRWELNSFLGLGIPGRIFLRNFIPSPRDKKFDELIEKYYGEIDVDIAKKIISTEPIVSGSTDGKITDSTHVEDFGLWCFMGKPDGTDFLKSEHPLDDQKRGYSDLPACGWVHLYGLSTNNNHRDSGPNQRSIEKTGRLYWEYEHALGECKDGVCSVPSDKKDAVFVSSQEDKVLAIDSETGRCYWAAEIGESGISSPKVIDDFVFVGSSDGIVALYKKTGECKWQNNLGAVSSQPAYAKGVVYCGSHDENLYALDADKGTIMWRYKTGGDIYSSPAVDNNIVYVGSNDGSLYAIGSETGEKKWSYETSGPVCSSPAVTEDVVYFGSWDNTLYAVDSKTGTLKWTFTTGWGIDSSPAIYEDTVFVGSEDTNLYAIDADDGTLKWAFSTHGSIKSSPTVYGGFVFVGSSDGTLYALNAETGRLEWSVAPDYHIQGIENYVTKPIDSSPLAYDGKVVVGSTNGKVYCFDAQTVEQPKPDEEIKIPLETWLFITIPLLCVILATALYLLWERRKLT
ncbi:MAG: PQQ-binding-like beta-propeller repeat protein [Candidatus Thermoplasmatota archaeon]|nr:PQQ-binding-like beta-propeller repeat protein [Candidatus Thermoplasmatota archaeon]